MREILLGFDARRSHSPAPANDDVYRRWHLLRDDVGDILSADTLLWPSISKRSRLVRRFWEELEMLEQRLATRAKGSCSVIAAVWHQDADHVGLELAPPVYPTIPPTRDPAWKFLGYDVTDGGFISGLSNCAYSEAERRQLSPIWGPRLNAHHLFDNIEHAFEFRPLTDRRVPEHAPFFVIGLWLIREAQ